MERVLLRPGDVQSIYGLNTQTLAGLRCRGDGPEFLRIGRRVFYEKDALERWIRAVSGMKSTCKGDE